MAKTRARDRTVGFISYLLILLPAIPVWLYVQAFGVNVIVGDAWSLARLFDEWSSGTLYIWDFFHLHNEHTMFFPWGVEFLLAGLTSYDNLIEMYIIQICLLATLITLLLAFREGVKPWLLLFVPISLLLFSFRQYENLLFGFQISFAFTQTFGVLALFLLHVSGRRSFNKLSFAAALGSATIACFSSAQGLLVWPAGLLQLLIGPMERPAKKVSGAVWGLAGLGEWVSYFIGFRSKDGTSLFYVLSHPAVVTEYFSNLLGSSLFWQREEVFAVGLLLACFALVSLLLVYRDRKLAEHSFWVSLLLFSFLALALITLGRSGRFGAIQALASRYTPFSILAVVSIYAMLVKTVFERRSRVRVSLLAVLCGVMLLGVSVSYPRGIEEGSKERGAREKAAFVLYTYETQPDEALTERLNSRASVVRERTPVLQSLGYNVFSEEGIPDLPPPLSVLSLVDSSAPPPHAFVIAGPGMSQQDRALVISRDASYVKVDGWAVDAENEGVAGGVYIEVDGEPFPAFYGIDRQDVADSFGDSSYRYSGFERAIPVSEIEAGTHELSVVILTNDKKGYYRPDQEVTLEVQ